MRPGSWVAAAAFLSPWTGCDRKERDVVREKRKEKEGE